MDTVFGKEMSDEELEMNRAINEMTETKGWKEYVEPFLRREQSFFNAIINKRGINGWVKDPHDIGHARGCKEEVDKIFMKTDKAKRVTDKYIKGDSK